MIRDEIAARFSGNLGRVKNVVAIYVAGASPGQGRRSVQETDLLRAAVVLLHATLEDLLRGIAEWRLPSAGADALANLALAGTKGKTRFDLGDLASYRGRTVDDVISLSVIEHLGRSNYNHPGDIRRLLEQIGIPTSLVDRFAANLASMMTRRHWIVHRADRNTLSGSGHHGAKSLSRTTVDRWITVVETFGKDLLAQT